MMHGTIMLIGVWSLLFSTWICDACVTRRWHKCSTIKATEAPPDRAKRECSYRVYTLHSSVIRSVYIDGWLCYNELSILTIFYALPLCLIICHFVTYSAWFMPVDASPILVLSTLTGTRGIFFWHFTNKIVDYQILNHFHDFISLFSR